MPWNSYNFKLDQIFLVEMLLLFQLTHVFEKYVKGPGISL